MNRNENDNIDRLTTQMIKHRENIQRKQEKIKHRTFRRKNKRKCDSFGCDHRTVKNQKMYKKK